MLNPYFIRIDEAMEKVWGLSFSYRTRDERVYREWAKLLRPAALF